MNVKEPDPSKWTAESMAAYCEATGLTRDDLAAFAKMQAAAGAAFGQGLKREVREEAHVRFKQAAARWAGALARIHLPLFRRDVEWYEKMDAIKARGGA